MSEDEKRYRANLHAMQTGVAFKMNYNPKETEPKHLRVGVNAAMSDLAAMAKLLISKGVITLEEYEKALADQMEIEVESYQKYLADKTGKTIHLA